RAACRDAGRPRLLGAVLRRLVVGLVGVGVGVRGAGQDLVHAPRLPPRRRRAMNRRGRRNMSIAANPILIGGVTVLVTIVAVFLSYNANHGLPFVPTYKVDVVLPNAD